MRRTFFIKLGKNDNENAKEKKIYVNTTCEWQKKNKSTDKSMSIMNLHLIMV